MKKTVSIIVSAALLTVGLVACPDKTEVTPPAEVVTTELILNGGFEAESNNWTFTGAGKRATSPATCKRTGSAYGSLSSATTSVQKAAQSINVPSQGTTLLKYWVRIQSSETAGTAFDNLVVKADATVISTLTTANEQEKYTEYTYDLTPLKGTSVNITFQGTFDNVVSTNFCIDDVSAINSK